MVGPSINDEEKYEKLLVQNQVPFLKKPDPHRNYLDRVLLQQEWRESYGWPPNSVSVFWGLSLQTRKTI